MGLQLFLSTHFFTCSRLSSILIDPSLTIQQQATRAFTFYSYPDDSTSSLTQDLNHKPSKLILNPSTLDIQNQERQSIIHYMAPSIQRNWGDVQNSSTEDLARVQLDSDYDSENVQGRSLKDFFTFRCFPPEVREIVWKFACQAPCTIEIDVASVRGREVEALKDVPVPAVLHVNHEARAVALNNYTLVTDVHPDNAIGALPFYTNYQFDNYHLWWSANGRRSKLFPSFQYVDHDRDPLVSSASASRRLSFFPSGTPYELSQLSAKSHTFFPASEIFKSISM